ncbi:LuxR C-terminal-related transcriptional regulator [Microbacterium sp. NPDC058345]|uniref:LuxR C-terminal-related transcriptional regulator n=1 Tax=Microbacterium sp. NPDC058345 TaxID=3346455 RepID=UPI00366888BD
MPTSPAALTERPTNIPLAWERQMRPALAAIDERAPRAALVGTAGSGKSASLQHLHQMFRSRARDARLVRADTVDLEDIPHEQVLLVDDLHLLPDTHLRHLSRRTEDPSASLIIARRPWPARPAVREIARRLEDHVPAIVLGHISRSDLLDHLARHELTLHDTCLDHILGATRGIAWLVAAAVQHHDARDCAHDGAHTELDRSLAELIVHRLDMVDDDLRRAVEEACVAAPPDAHVVMGSADDAWVLQGYAQGLLLRGGDTAPIVRLAVRQSLPARRLVELFTRFPRALEHREGLRPLRDPRVADALIAHADRLLSAQPARAAELYDASIECGADADAVSARRAYATWSAGDLDRATALVEETIATAPGVVDATTTAVSAAMWSARAMMTQADEVYRLVPPRDATALANATIAAFGVGAVTPPAAPPPADRLPSPLGVSMALLRSGLETTVNGSENGEASLPLLVRSCEMYAGARHDEALCELPAVIAAIVALNLGRLATAQSVLDDAIAREHRGSWAARRLLLWRAWIAVQRAHPIEARDLLRRASATTSPALPVRDELLMHAVRVAIARRYEDASGLESAWREARGCLLRAEIDLYLLHPLTELISAATRVGDAARVETHLTRALEIVEALGDPPVWAAHMHWAGIQQGILLSRPDRLAPHAKALVAIAPRSRVAAMMAKAGRVWTDVLAGSVDADAIMGAAAGLATVGLMWDAARLAGHGAARTDDRRVAAQLLACARELHPNDGTRRPAPATDEDVQHATQAPPQEVLSEREIEVARLVLQGKTYAEIGQSIFISPRTAEHHIAHIRRRLGATSRSEVLARLRLLLGENGVSTGGPEESP